MGFARNGLILLTLLGAYVLYPFTQSKHPESLHTTDPPEPARDYFRSPSTGLWLYQVKWEPVSEPRGVAVLLHGIAEHSRRYDHVAKVLTDEGFVVYAMDHQGHGRSQGVRGHVEKFDDFVKDARNFAEISVAKHKDLPRFLIGHSMGGLIAASVSMEQDPEFWTGVVLSGPPLKVDPSLPEIMIKAAKYISLVLPQLPVGEKLAVDKVVKNKSAQEDYASDPLNYHGTIRARTGWELLQQMDKVFENTEKFTFPVLLLVSEEDQICLAEGSKKLYREIPSDEKRIVRLFGMAHEIFNEENKAEVFRHMTTWINEQMPGYVPPVEDSIPLEEARRNAQELEEMQQAAQEMMLADESE